MATVGRRLDSERLITIGLLGAIALYLCVALLLPLYSVISRAVEDRDGNFVGGANFHQFFETPGLSDAVLNSIWTSSLVTVITVSLAFLYAYGIARTRMPGRRTLRGIAMIPIMSPSLLPAIALVYIFGQQGVFRSALMGHSIYGPIGIVIGECLFTFPHAVLILTAAFAGADQRLYEAASALRAGPVRVFFTVTLPGCRYGLAGAAIAVFTIAFTDFGVPAVIGGSYPVLATQVYQQVVGRFDFQMGAVTAIFLLAPAVLSFTIERMIQHRSSQAPSSAAVPLRIARNWLRDTAFLIPAVLVALFLLGVISMAIFGSLVRFWPYDLSLSLNAYDFSRRPGDGWAAYRNSWILALSTACIGTVIIVTGAYLVDKGQGMRRLRMTIHALSLIPLAVPGIVLGLAYIFFFNSPTNPLNVIYSTMAILIISTITYFYTVPHMMMLTSLKQLNCEFEAVGASLKVPFYVTLWRVTLPCCLPTILNVWGYLFVNAMTTVAAVVFLYSANTQVAAVIIVNWNNGGHINSSAALSVVLFATAAAVWIMQAVAGRYLLRRAMMWNQPTG